MIMMMMMINDDQQSVKEEHQQANFRSKIPMKMNRKKKMPKHKVIQKV
jgi:hypothetical protein